MNADFHRQIWRFSIAGIANTAFGLAIIFTFIYLGVNALLANLLGYGLGFIFAFFVSTKWTFENNQPIKTTAPLFLMSAAISYTLNLVTLFILQQQTNLGPYMVQVGGVAVYAITMFILCRILVFK